MTNAEEPAFPEINHDNPKFNYPTYGLTKREYFAVMAMQGLLTRVPERNGGEVDLGILESKRIAQEACIMADALIKALNEQP